MQNKGHHKIKGQVYLWTPDPSIPLGGTLEKAIVSLPEMEKQQDGKRILSNSFVVVENAGKTNIPGTGTIAFVTIPMGNAQADEDGHYIFEPHFGGCRIEKTPLVDESIRVETIEAARFGEVNTFYHTHKIAAHVNELLEELRERPLPQVKVLINAHCAVGEKDGCRDGCIGTATGNWIPFQGGHYRLSGQNLTKIPEINPVAPDGEIHLGPGWKRTADGALPVLAQALYRCNASHNGGTIYHEYGHHINRHTADFMANRLKAPHRQINRKTALDEAMCDYWTATMLDCPHIWAWHRKHTVKEIHPRSLASKKTMADFDSGKKADPHLNGTIYAASLWDVRKKLCALDADGGRRMDMLVLKSALIIGQQQDSAFNPSWRGTRKCRRGFGIGLWALLQANEVCFQGMDNGIITKCFQERGIAPKAPVTNSKDEIETPTKKQQQKEEVRIERSIQHILKLDPNAIIPKANKLLSKEALEQQLTANQVGSFSLTAVGDIMLGSRMNKYIAHFGPEYTFHSVYPILRRSSIALGNLEGPFAAEAMIQPRKYSYKVDPKNARILRRAGFNVMTMANNHLLDCGREGVLETFAALEKQGIKYIGAGKNEATAHAPAIMQAGKFKVGLLAYYWNRRTAAKGDLPGSAQDLKEQVAYDIAQLRPQVDRIVVTVHWGVPYERVPSGEDQEKARFAIDSGADMVIGHHPHIVQPFEVYNGCPIFYSVGNFAFGSGNSKAESIMLGVKFKDTTTDVTIFPAYIKNRDRRVNYQPRIMTGHAAQQSIDRLKNMSGESGEKIHFKGNTGWVQVPFVVRKMVVNV